MVWSTCTSASVAHDGAVPGRFQVASPDLDGVDVDAERLVIARHPQPHLLLAGNERRRVDGDAGDGTVHRREREEVGVAVVPHERERPSVRPQARTRILAIWK